MNYLLDTNVISETIRPFPDANVISWLGGIARHQLFLSVLTIGEIKKGIANFKDQQKRTKLSLWLEEDLANWFMGRILPIDQAIAKQWGQMEADSSQKLPVIDTLLAASAIQHKLVLVTRNQKDFVDFDGLLILNPWNQKID